MLFRSIGGNWKMTDSAGKNYYFTASGTVLTPTSTGAPVTVNYLDLLGNPESTTAYPNAVYTLTIYGAIPPTLGPVAFSYQPTPIFDCTSCPTYRIAINLTAAKVSAFGLGGAIAGLAGGVYAHYATHIEHGNFGILLATFAIAYPILGGLSSLAGTLLAVVFIQGFLLEGLRFLGDWRSLLFGVLIVVVMLVRPNGLLTRSLTLTIFDKGRAGAK